MEGLEGKENEETELENVHGQSEDQMRIANRCKQLLSGFIIVDNSAAVFLISEVLNLWHHQL